jgi:hypothetical protein
MEIVLTAQSLVIRAAANLTTFDQKCGDEVGAVCVPRPQNANPISYTYDAKHCIKVAV